MISGLLALIELLALLAFATFLYALPTFIAFRNQANNAATVAVVNLFLGWTVIGWVVSLAMAVADPRPAVPYRNA